MGGLLGFVSAWNMTVNQFGNGCVRKTEESPAGRQEQRATADKLKSASTLKTWKTT